MLIRYLEQLHLRGVACSEHTMLLMNCYTKLHDHKKLQQFIEEDSLSSHYDPKTAIEALTSAGFYNEALQLAANHHLHEWYVSIQVEKTNSLKEAMNYITTLPPKEAAKALIRYGKKLVDVVPELVTPFLIHLCTEGETQEPQLFIYSLSNIITSTIFSNVLLSIDLCTCSLSPQRGHTPFSISTHALWKL